MPLLGESFACAQKSYLTRAGKKDLITSITFDDISPAYLSTLKLRWLIDLLNEMNILCTFFVVPDLNANSSHKSEFASCVKTASDFGHELSLHGYRHTKNEFGYLYPVPLPVIPLPPLKKQKECIAQAKEVLIQLTGMSPLGFRAPFYLYNNATLKALSSLNFKYDSSKTVFKPTHGARLRVRWTRNCNPHRVHGIIEIPLTGDYTFNLKNSNFSDSVKRALRDFEWTKSRNGVFVMTIHPNRLNRALLRLFLQALVDKLHGKTDFVRLVDVNL
jgi:predicted deacetylase